MWRVELVWSNLDRWSFPVELLTPLEELCMDKQCVLLVGCTCVKWVCMELPACHRQYDVYYSGVAVYTAYSYHFTALALLLPLVVSAAAIEDEASGACDSDSFTQSEGLGWLRY